MDCDMPIMDGFEATSLLKNKMSSGALSYVPIVALTAYASNKVEEECQLAGMDDICMQLYIYIYIYYIDDLLDFKPISLDKVKVCLTAFNILFTEELE